LISISECAPADPQFQPCRFCLDVDTTDSDRSAGQNLVKGSQIQDECLGGENASQLAPDHVSLPGIDAPDGVRLAADQVTGEKAPSDDKLLIANCNALYLEKLIIDEDAESVEGPPTPDHEESGRVSMPATKRQRVALSSSSMMAASFARALFMI